MNEEMKSLPTEPIAPVAQIPEAPKTLVEEILEEQQRRAMPMLDPDRMVAQLEQRLAALEKAKQLAIQSTRPIHWLLFKNRQGQIFARFNNAGAWRIAQVFGVHVEPDGDIEIVTDEQTGKRTAQIYGTVRTIFGVRFERIRGYRVEGEEFMGRPAEDTIYRQGTSNEKRVAGVGPNDWIQCARTALDSKCIRIASGLITVDPGELAEAWGKTREWVIQNCTQGPGFTAQERGRAAKQTAGPISEPQAKRAFALAGKRLGRLKSEFPDAEIPTPKDLVREICLQIVPNQTNGDIAKCPRSEYEKVCNAIEAWGSDPSQASPVPSDGFSQ